MRGPETQVSSTLVVDPPPSYLRDERFGGGGQAVLPSSRAGSEEPLQASRSVVRSGRSKGLP